MTRFVVGSLIITSLTTGILAILFVALSGRVIYFRRRDLVGIGYGESKDLRRAIRVHANFAEYVPLALVMLALLETSSRVSAWPIWALAGILVVSRILHAIGLSGSAGTSIGRFVGAGLTLLYLLVSAGLLVWVGVCGALGG